MNTPSLRTALIGAVVVDGTGADRRRADVVVSDGAIVDVVEAGGLDLDSVDDIVDLGGLVLAPGFIDSHTHYDAQILWDPDLTPSGWHGVTTVLMGNCGFGLAPLRPEQRETIALTLENVEGMSAEVLGAGIRWEFESFPEYLDMLRREPPRLNVGVFLGHTPLRLFVMGDDATERPATEEEIERMCALLREAMAAGALGFATSRSPNHNGAHGKPVPSRAASDDEIERLCGVLGELGAGVIQASPGPGLSVDTFARLAAETGRPVTWTALFTGLGRELLAAADTLGTATELLEMTRRLGGGVWPQIAVLPQVMQITFEDPFPFGMLPSFKEILALPRSERSRLYADPDWRARARSELPERWEHRWVKTTVDESEVHRDLVRGPTVARIAADRGVDPFALMLDLSLEESLQTRFRVVLGNDDQDELIELFGHPDVIVSVSDAGAHASQLCDARFATHLLGHWCRERGVVTLETAVWRLTGQIADVFGLHDRGRIAPGMAADLVAFDPATVGDLDPERVRDLPAGGDRLVARSTGIQHIWVNGQRVRADGEDLPDRRVGQLLTGAAATG